MKSVHCISNYKDYKILKAWLFKQLRNFILYQFIIIKVTSGVLNCHISHFFLTKKFNPSTFLMRYTSLFCVAGIMYSRDARKYPLSLIPSTWYTTSNESYGNIWSIVPKLSEYGSNLIECFNPLFMENSQFCHGNQVSGEGNL